ncbi:SDR family NAD(P)-dependent oxidoreductase [Nocardioides litoris]|uniref:SDR family NAD(P)-dependent oxidoreductase n=1 Tax=Nocardioides litoris TaxID=1926648 RepID=UPI0011227B66|nr:SDR family NAD(P)-dependent oxidoreductase [Nocardioides litoris]
MGESLDLRWRTVLVTDSGAGLGREVAVRAARRGAAVVAVDRDAAAAEATAVVVRRSRVPAWAVQADLDHPDDLLLLAGRLRDLGGADLLVTASPAAVPAFVDALSHRRGRPGLVPTVVVVGSEPPPDLPDGVRLTCLDPAGRSVDDLARAALTGG